MVRLDQQIQRKLRGKGGMFSSLSKSMVMSLGTFLMWIILWACIILLVSSSHSHQWLEVTRLRIGRQENVRSEGQQNRLTYAFTANATGSKKLLPIVIASRKAYKPQAFSRKAGMQLRLYYQNNVKSWMTSPLYQEWLQQWDWELVTKNYKIILLQDNFPAHIVPDVKNICM